MNVQRDSQLEADAGYANDSISGADVLDYTDSGTSRLASVAGTVMGGESGNVDEDYFALGELSAGETLSLLMALRVWSGLTTILEIRNLSNEVVQVISDPLGGIATFNPLETDDYYVLVTASGGEGLEGQYRLDVEVSSS